MADPRVLDELERRLSEAMGPDRVLDLAIGLSIAGWEYKDAGGELGKLLFVPEDNTYFSDAPGSMYPALTESLDLALALAEEKLPGWGNSSIKTGDNEYAAYIWEPVSGGAEYRAEGILSTRAIAILTALIRALKEKGDG